MNDASILISILIIISLLIVIVGCYTFYFIKKIKSNQLKKRTDALIEKNQQQTELSQFLCHEIADYHAQLNILKGEIEQKKQEQEQLKILQEDNALENYLNKKKDLESQLELLKNKLVVASNQDRSTIDQEDFEKTHSIYLTDEDLNDIRLLNNFSNSISKPSIIRKLIWSEFYQKPLSEMIKNLKANKISGIYKITNKKTKQCYIGQSVDIGDRWQQHVKSALGAGLCSYLTNKFYKAMHNDGVENFTFEILQECSKDKNEMNENERYWINYFNSKNNGYNSTGGNK